MNVLVKLLYLVVITAFFISCSASKKATASSDLEGTQHVMLDTMTVMGESSSSDAGTEAEYKPARERKWDLIHTSLDLSFDWLKEQVNGTATLTLTPLFYAQTSLQIDAVKFDIHSIKANGQPLTTYKNADDKIDITLPKTFKKDEQLKIEISYTAHPTASRDLTGGAVTSDRGLFFVDSQDTIPGVPRQLWSQGETSYNRRWFPTLDQPNERGTQEVILTVEDSMMTISNGLLVSSTPLPGGMRRDQWKLDLPHAPYLTMIAVGQWDKVTEYWRGRPVDYYVDLGYGPSAKAIFANTPEMIEFFSKRLGYDFVWPKYTQVIVKNFVSGAMENTTAVVFSDYIEFKQEEMVEDGANDYIVAHELFHHWFGDLVTCESWANTTLNEGFANYAEYLWFEHKYGRERADISRLSELSGYFDQTENTSHPLINYHYADENDMFDAHSYNKGGLVLHMLRDLVGDEAFFASLNLYLRQNAYKSAEADDLRQAFEEVTGTDLHWFFNQWYFDKGHPVLDIHHAYDASEHQLNLTISQVQDSQGYRDLFILPIEIAIFHQDSSIEIQKISMDEKTMSFHFDEMQEPMAVVIDPRDILLAVVHHEIPPSEYNIRLMSRDLSINHRISALRLMDDIEPLVLDELIRDTSHTMRALLISHLDEKEDAARLYQLAQVETRPEIQYYILESLMKVDAAKAKEVALNLLKTTNRIPVIYASLKAVAAVDADEASRQYEQFQSNPSPAIYAAGATIYAKSGKGITLDYFRTERAANISDDYLEEFIGALALYISGQSSAVQDEGLALIDSDFYLRTVSPEYRRFYLITGMLNQYVEDKDPVFKAKIMATINILYKKETNEYLRSVLKEGLGDLLD